MSLVLYCVINRSVISVPEYKIPSGSHMWGFSETRGGFGSPIEEALVKKEGGWVLAVLRDEAFCFVFFF